MCCVDLRVSGNPAEVANFSSGTGPVFLTQVGCSIDDTSLLTCGVPVFVHTCTHEMDVGVRCPGK